MPRECQPHIYNKHCNDVGVRRVSHAAEAECIKGDGEVEWDGRAAHPSRMQQPRVYRGPADAMEVWSYS